MKLIPQASLATVLLLAGCNDKPSLEEKADQFTNGIYITDINPEHYGLAHTDSKKFNAGKFLCCSDTFKYESSSGLYVCRLPNMALELKGLSGAQHTDIYDITCSNYHQHMQSRLQPGEGFRIVGEGEPRKISIGDIKGITGGAGYWFFMGEDNLLANKFSRKIDIRIAVAQDSEYTYSFILVSEKDGRHDRLKMFEQFLSTFRLVK